jgi:hypothetical protein
MQVFGEERTAFARVVQEGPISSVEWAAYLSE